MLKPALAVCGKDLALAGRGGAFVQALLLGLLLVFLFSLSTPVGGRVTPQAAATVFWLASAFCQVLVFNALFALEEANGSRLGLVLAPTHASAVWLGKLMAGLALVMCCQAVLAPATVIFLGQSLSGQVATGLAALLLTDLGMAALGALLGAMAQGQSSRESLLSVILFPLLLPVLLAGVRSGEAALGPVADPVGGWLGLAAAFDAVFLACGLVLFPHLYATDG